jgi:protein-disulfide isomerase-like protein with CxxC motif
MQKEAGNHQLKLQQIVKKLSGSLDSTTINEAAHETELKASEMMKTYLGENPDSFEAIEFLCLAEGGEVTHYEVLATLAKKVKLSSKQLSNTISSILKQEQRHLKLCIKLAKEAAAS